MNGQTMSYKGYIASVGWSEEHSDFHGEVTNLDDPGHFISFRGFTLQEIRTEFEEMIEWYLQECNKDGIQPSKPVAEAIAQSV
jgi:predicted HicB family RNase H-like nuclease